MPVVQCPRWRCRVRICYASAKHGSRSHGTTPTCPRLSRPLARGSTNGSPRALGMLSPLDRKLALAPLDDEPVTLTESAAIAAGIASLESNGGVPLEEVLSDGRGALGLRSHHGGLPRNGRNGTTRRIRRECLDGSISPLSPCRSPSRGPRNRVAAAEGSGPIS